MACKCIVCGVSDVEHPGDICELCAVGQDPYAFALQQSTLNNDYTSSRMTQQRNNSNTYCPGKGKSRKVLLDGGASIKSAEPHQNEIDQTEDDYVQAVQDGQTPVSSSNKTQTNIYTSDGLPKNKKTISSALSNGIVKNVMVDTQKSSVFRKILRSLFNGIPYTLDDDVTVFQVFPDYSGTSLNALGYACDQVIVYGKINAGAVSENNNVEVYGHRDSNNNIVANKIINKASGTTITPDRTISVAVVWCFAIAVFLIMTMITASFGVNGIIWTVIVFLFLTNLPLVFKIFLFFGGLFFSIFRRK